MIIHMMEQRSPEWYEVKCGKIGASSMSSVLAKGTGKTRMSYMMKLLAERDTGVPSNNYVNDAMLYGIENEEYARNAYEMETGNTVEQVGFVELNDFVGCSPDALVGDDGLLEIKVPNSDTHLKYILEDRIPPEYVVQVQTQLWVTGRKWLHFVSYNPRSHWKPFWMVETERDEETINKIESGVEAFVAELLELERKIKDENK